MLALRIAILNVGHGDFIYAETPLGDNLVIDLGTGDVVPSMFLSKVSTISELQISHPHTDHLDDIINFSQKTIKSFRCPNLTNIKDNSIGWKRSDKAKIAKLREIKNSIYADNAAVRVGNGFSHSVWYPNEKNDDDPNTIGTATILAYGGVKVLFGADLPESAWESLSNNLEFVNAINGTSILKVPHHGRKEGCSDTLFRAITPMLCVVSDKALDKDNKNTVASNWYSERTIGCNVVGEQAKRKILSTRNDGSVFIKINGDGKWWVYKNTSWKTD